jgi:hypothetical protein
MPQRLDLVRVNLMARRVVQPGGRAKCAAPFIEGLPALVVVLPKVTPGQARADQCGLIKGPERVSDGDGSRAIVCRTACVEQCDLRRHLPAPPFELADGPGCLCSVVKAHLQPARLTSPRGCTAASRMATSTPSAPGSPHAGKVRERGPHRHLNYPNNEVAIVVAASARIDTNHDQRAHEARAPEQLSALKMAGLPHCR